MIKAGFTTTRTTMAALRLALARKPGNAATRQFFVTEALKVGRPIGGDDLDKQAARIYSKHPPRAMKKATDNG